MKISIVSLLILATGLISGCASVTYRSGEDHLVTWPHRAEGVFEGISVLILFPEVVSGFSAETDQFGDPPRKSFQLGSVKFVFLRLEDDTVDVTVNSVHLGSLHTGDSVTLTADGLISVNNGAANYQIPNWVKAAGATPPL